MGPCPSARLLISEILDCLGGVQLLRNCVTKPLHEVASGVEISPAAYVIHVYPCDQRNAGLQSVSEWAAACEAHGIMLHLYSRGACKHLPVRMAHARALECRLSSQMIYVVHVYPRNRAKKLMRFGDLRA